MTHCITHVGHGLETWVLGIEDVSVCIINILHELTALALDATGPEPQAVTKTARWNIIPGEICTFTVTFEGATATAEQMPWVSVMH